MKLTVVLVFRVDTVRERERDYEKKSRKYAKSENSVRKYEKDEKVC